MVDTNYATLEQLKNSLTLDDDVANDDYLQSCLTTASRHIDRFTRRRFFLDDVVSQRTYSTGLHLGRMRDGDLLVTDDIGAAAGVVVEYWDGSTWLTIPDTDYGLYPENGLVQGWAATGILALNWAWPVYRRRWWVYPKMRVTAKWGWPTIPAEVEQACLLHARRLFYRKDSASGLMGDPQWGMQRVPFADPDFRALLAPLQILSD